MDRHDIKALARKIGGLPVGDGQYADNLAIALATHFEGLPDCPEDGEKTEHGWTEWATERTDALLVRIVETILAEVAR